MSILELDTKKNRQVNQANQALPEPEREFKTKNNKEYEVKVIIDSMVYS